MPVVIPAGITPTDVGTAIAKLPANASNAAIAAAIGAIPAGGGGTAATAIIPAGATPATVVTAITTSAATTPAQIAAAISAIPAVATPMQNPAGAQPQAPSMINAALNSNTPLQQATIVPETKLIIDEQKGKFAILDAGADLEELVNALNILGTSPREMAQILQSIKAAGALHAEVIVS